MTTRPGRAVSMTSLLFITGPEFLLGCLEPDRWRASGPQPGEFRHFVHLDGQGKSQASPEDLPEHPCPDHCRRRQALPCVVGWCHRPRRDPPPPHLGPAATPDNRDPERSHVQEWEPVPARSRHSSRHRRVADAGGKTEAVATTSTRPLAGPVGRQGTQHQLSDIRLNMVGRAAPGKPGIFGFRALATLDFRVTGAVPLARCPDH